MSHHFQRKSLISRGLHEKVGLLGYRDLGNGTGNFSYDHAYWVTVNIFFEEKKCKLRIVTAYFLARFEKMLFSDIQRGGGEELQMLIQVAVLFRLKCEHIHKVP